MLTIPPLPTLQSTDPPTFQMPAGMASAMPFSGGMPFMPNPFMPGMPFMPGGMRPGGMPGGMPSGMPDINDPGPTIDEVD